MGNTGQHTGTERKKERVSGDRVQRRTIPSALPSYSLLSWLGACLCVLAFSPVCVSGPVSTHNKRGIDVSHACSSNGF